MEKEKIEDYVKRIKLQVEREMKKKNYEAALNCIASCASVIYCANLYYEDNYLEETLNIISNKILKINDYNVDEKTVIFYDGFGLENRGLAKIYLKSLCKYVKVIYVTYSNYKKRLSNFENMIKNAGGVVEYINNKNKCDGINDLNTIIRKYSPKYFFFYSMPHDVIGSTILYAYDGIITRFQINLTDHAFWLGAHCIDYCIEFREYGASISFKYRHIPIEKMILLPYYPEINDSTFKGYPFVDGDNRKFIFSGGSLYKTFSENDYYYKIIDYIMNKYPTVLFWYAGEGDSSRIESMSNKYPNRVYYTHERPDFYEIIKRSYFYLSTYPVCGGLMFQYAARAGKIPLTLRFDSITDDFLLKQSELNIQFDTYKEFIVELDHIMTDEAYVISKEQEMCNSVISEKEFDEMISMLLNENKSKFNIKIRDVNTDLFRSEYIKSFNKKELYSIVSNPSYVCLIEALPKEYLVGLFFKMAKKMSKIIKETRGN